MGPAPETDWNAPSDEVLHLWNERIGNFIAHGFTSHAKTTGTWQSKLPLCLHIGGFNVCCRGMLLVLVAWAVHDIRTNENFMRIENLQISDRGGKRLWMTLSATHI